MKLLISKNKDGKCRASYAIKVLREEEGKYGRHKWDYGAKKLIQVPGYIYSLPPEPFILSRNGSSWQKIAISWICWQQEVLKIECSVELLKQYFQRHQNPWTSFEQASEVH